MNDKRLLILAKSETPALLIDLEPGQQYIGKDDRPDGTMMLIIDLGDQTHLTETQADFLITDPATITFAIVPGWTAPTVTHSIHPLLIQR